MKNLTLRNLFATIALCLSFFTAFADIPAGYYKSLNGKSEANLKTAIHNLLKDHTLVSSYNALPQYFRITDVYNDGTNRWWDMYSNQNFYLPSFSGLNREHSFPKSWWGGDTSTPAYVDLNHLYPSEVKANSAKLNFPLGEVATPSFDNGCSKVGTPVTGQGGGAQKVFEPDDRYKGDLARAYMYMVCCYQNLTWKYTYMVQQNTYPTLTSWAINLLLKWHREDPPSEKEYNRNEEVYKIQNNRNPFIDYPDLAEYIWGNKKGQLFYESNTGGEPSGDPNLITPVQGMTLDFGQVAIGQSTTARLLFRGENLTGSVSLALSTADKALFSIPTKSISTSKINTPTGYELEITYTPNAVGKHTSKLIISDGGITGSRGIILNAECCEVPTVKPVKALPATDIQENSYVANWEAAEGEVDGYIVTRTRMNNGVSSQEEIEAEDNFVEIEDFASSTSESYTVQAVRLGYRSEPSNVIFVEHAGVTGIEADMQLGTANIPGGVRFVCSQPQHNVSIFDMTGKMIMNLPVVENDDTVELPYGVYLITVPAQRTPLKVMIQ